MGQVVAEISIVPIGTAGPSISGYVTACYNALKTAKDIRFQLTAMSTIVEGPLERVLEVAQRMHQLTLEKGAPRVLTSIKIDERGDKPLTIEGKVRAVLGKGL